MAKITLILKLLNYVKKKNYLKEKDIGLNFIIVMTATLDIIQQMVEKVQKVKVLNNMIQKVI